MGKVLIIEPHADDALFSLYSIMSNSDCKSIDILTCCTHKNGRSSSRLPEYIQSIDKVTSLDYSENNFLWSIKNFNHNDINRISKDPEMDTYQVTRNYIKEVAPYYQSLQELSNLITEYLKGCDYEMIYVPAGIVHPFHIITTHAFIMSNYKLNYPVVYYAERPYTHKKFTYRILDDFIKYHLSKGYCKVNLSYDGNDKEFIIEQVYPGELQGFHWDRPKILELPEMIIHKEGN